MDLALDDRPVRRLTVSIAVLQSLPFPVLSNGIPSPDPKEGGKDHNPK